MDRMAERLAAQPALLDRRRESAEHPFGTIKPWHVPDAAPEQRPKRVQPDSLDNSQDTILAYLYPVRFMLWRCRRAPL